jgi:1-acyl-sn-glycerol-3-phosphate acyltransferase
MPKVVRALITGSGFVVFFTGGIVLGWLVLPLLGIFGWTAKGRTALRIRLMTSMYRFFDSYMTLGGLLTIRRHPLPHDFPRAGEPFVMISNHPCLIDVVHLLAYFPGMSSMATHHYYKSITLGKILALTGHISAPPSRHISQIDGPTTVDVMTAHLKAGNALLVFPEGTRSPLRGLRRFRRGAVEAAVRAGVPIVPVFISQDPPTLMKGQPWYEVPDRKMRFEIEIFPIIHTAGRELDARALHNELYLRYQERCRVMLAARDVNARKYGDRPTPDRFPRTTDKILGPAPGVPTPAPAVETRQQVE